MFGCFACVAEELRFRLLQARLRHVFCLRGVEPVFELLSLSDPASVKERTTSMCPCLARFHTLLGSAAWAVALKSGRRPQARCPCRRPSVVTEGYRGVPPQPPPQLGVTPSSPRRHPVVTPFPPPPFLSLLWGRAFPRPT